MTKAVTKSQVFLARLVVVLIVAFVVGGLIWYGFSAEVRARVWQNLFERPGGPMVFRFFLQPTMAAIAAWRDGVNDARTGRTPFFAGALTDPAQRTVRLNEALVATARIILLGLVMDGIYQAIEFKYLPPGRGRDHRAGACLRSLPAAAWADRTCRTPVARHEVCERHQVILGRLFHL